MDIDWAAPAEWNHRSPDFDKLRVHDDGRLIPAMEYVAPLAPRTRELWLELPRHPNLLDPLEPFDNGLLLRYAALDWKRPTLRIGIAGGTQALATIANWGVQLATLFETIFWDVDAKDHASFLAPTVFIDLDGEVRVAFSTHDRFRPPEQRIDERSFVYVIGKVMESLVEAIPPTEIGQIIERCIERRPADRFPRLQVLTQSCRRLARRDPVRVAERLTAWDHVEEAIGWLAVGEKGRAASSFGDASFYSHYERYWEWGLRQAIRVPRRTVIVEHGLANDRLVALPAHPALQLSPARASYLEGREHFLHRRLHEAQICFASAILLDPMMLEAQLLRREVDRTLARVRATTGTPNAMPIDVPAALRDVRELVVAGRIRDAIAALSTEAYAANVDAALFRARLLALDGQYALAASAYAAIDDGPHVDEARLGLARVTIDRGKPDAALAILDALLVTRPRDLGVLEARARCLDLLGRTDEASAAMKAFVAAVELASDIRLERRR